MDSKQFFISVNGKRVEVTEEVYLTYYRSKRRERYFEQDIKIETPVRDKDANIIGYAPSKEDSLERLIATGAEFPDEQDSVEDAVIRELTADKLHEALDALTEDERALIEALFYEGKTERQAADVFGISQKGINKRKTKILEKLKKLIES